MPGIRLDLDDAIVSDAESTALSEAVRKIIIEATKIDDVFVYGNAARIKVAIAPIELFIQMSDHKIADEKALFEEIKSKLHGWKDQSNFPHKINMTFIPMHWYIGIDI